MSLKGSLQTIAFEWFGELQLMKHVYSYHEAQVGPKSPVSVSEYLMSAPISAGRIFESRSYMFHPCLCRLPYLRPTNYIIVQ